MAIKTGIALIASSTTVFALGLVVAQWRARAQRRVTIASSLVRPPKSTTEHAPTKSAVSAVHLEPLASAPDDDLQLLDGGVSARPAERWHDRSDEEAYDAANPDDLGAQFLARAVQVPREMDEELLDFEENGLSVEELSDEDDLRSETLDNGAQLDDNVADEVALDVEFDDDAAFDAELEDAFNATTTAGPTLEDASAQDAESEAEAWYASLKDPARSRHRG